jgi:hypothetical protein
MRGGGLCLPSARVAASDMDMDGSGAYLLSPVAATDRTGQDTGTKLVAAARAMKPARISR